MAKQAKVAVQFVKKCSPYNSGEIAGFSPERAKQLIDQKFAKPYTERGVVTKDEKPAEDKEKSKGKGKDK